MAILAVAIGLTGCGATSDHSRGPALSGAALSGAVHLSAHTVAPGGVLQGEVVFTNRTSRPIFMMSWCHVDGRFAIGFHGHDAGQFGPAFSAVGCLPDDRMYAPPGTSSYPFTVAAGYDQCSQTTKEGYPRGSRFWMPICLKDSSGQRDLMPPLPAGVYSAYFVPDPDGRWQGPAVAPARFVVRR